ncbi:MAG: MlaD family protein [Tepidisphaeraceae bacterium]|jgi:phospholipid/cholesterol/gamma-HCH transport system substrate-binding protein
MAKQRNALRAGIFMILSLGLIVFVIVAISGAARFTQSFHTYSVAFSLQDDLGGLRPGDDVRIGGVKVGSIRDIRIDRDRSAVVVLIDVPAKFPLAKDAGIRVQHGLTGSSSINIDSFGTGSPLAADDFLAGQPDQVTGLVHELAAMKPDVIQILGNLKIASGKLNVDLDKLAATSDSLTASGFEMTSTVQGLRVRVPEIIDRYQSAVDAVVRMLDAVRQFVGPSSGDFHQTLANLNHVSGDLRGRLPEVLDRLQTVLGKAGVVVDRAANAMQDIQAAAANLHSATGALQSILADNRSRLNGILVSLKTTSDNLKDASVEIRHSPWRLLYQPKPDEVANLNIYDSVRQFAEGADSLDDAAASLRDALKDPNADPEQVKRLMLHLNDSFAQFQQVQDKLWKEIKE